MATEKVTVLCYRNGNIKYGPIGVYYEGPTILRFRAVPKSKLNSLLNGICKATGLDKEKSKLELFGRYPVVVSPDLLMYVHRPVVNDSDLESMLEVPSKHPSIEKLEMYLEDRSVSDNVASSSKRQRTQQEMVGKCSEPCLMSGLWIEDDHALRVGLCFKDGDELKKAVHWYSIIGQRKCITRETEKDMYTFECVGWRCKWSLCAARMEGHGLVEVTTYTAPHTCHEDQKYYDTEFAADQIEPVVRVHPTQSYAELNKWWKDKFDYELETCKIRDSKWKVIKRVFGDEDESFRVMPKLMYALCSSNGLVVDWKYDAFPNHEYASFRGVFWAFPQSIQGFEHCRPLILVDSEDCNDKYSMRLMIASGVDAANNYFPLAFAVTKEVSLDSWRWFLTGVREKVTQRKGICLISSPHPDILAVIKEPESRWQEPWAYHRFSLHHLCSQFNEVFQDYYLESDVERAGWMSRKEDFDSCMNEIKEKNTEAWKWLDQFPPHQWALAHDNGLRYEIMETDTGDMFDICDGFLYYTVGMTGALLHLFDELRNTFDESISSCRASLGRGDVYTEAVMDKLEEFRTASITYIITPLEKDTFQVTEAEPLENKKWIVQLSNSTCTCGEFQICKLPCVHALAVCHKLKINPLQYVDDCYTLERYCKTYAAKFSPVPQVSAWQEASQVPKLFPPVVAPPPEEVSGDKFNEVTDMPQWAYCRKKVRSQRKTFPRKSISLQERSI